MAIETALDFYQKTVAIRPPLLSESSSFGCTGAHWCPIAVTLEELQRWVSCYNVGLPRFTSVSSICNMFQQTLSSCDGKPITPHLQTRFLPRNIQVGRVLATNRQRNPGQILMLYMLVCVPLSTHSKAPSESWAPRGVPQPE